MLSLDLLTRDFDDPELPRFRVQAKLVHILDQFREYNLCLVYKDILNFRLTLEDCLVDEKRIVEALKEPDQVTGCSPINVYAVNKRFRGNFELAIHQVQKTISWALPHVREVEKVGQEIFAFLAYDIDLAWLEPEPFDKSEGYVLIPGWHKKVAKYFILSYRQTRILTPYAQYPEVEITYRGLAKEKTRPRDIKRCLEYKDKRKTPAATVLVKTDWQADRVFSLQNAIVPVVQQLLGKLVAA